MTTIDFNALLDAPKPPAVCLMPTAPASAELPPGDDLHTLAFLEAVSQLHLAAFIIKHGGPPAGLELISLEFASAGGPLRPHYACSAHSVATMDQVLWLDAFRDGLLNWAEAGFPDPIEVTDQGPAARRYSLAPIDEVLRSVCSRLAAAGRARELHDLVVHFREHVPDRFNPASPRYVGAA